MNGVRNSKYETVTPGGSPPGRLLGERLADELEVLSERGVLPALDSVGVILAGDLFTDPRMARRGGAGDVRGVWRAFASRCRWVAGVAGNHDVFGSLHSGPELDAFRAEAGIHLLDGDVIELDGLKIAGLSGIIGNPKRPWRRPETAFTDLVLDMLSRDPDVLVLHDGPDVPGKGLRGWPCIREALELGPARLVVRGHAWWATPLCSLDHRIQVLNVDSRVVVLGSADMARAPQLGKSRRYLKNGEGSQ